MNRNDFVRMIALASEIGADAAFDEFQDEMFETFEAERDAERDCDDRRYVYGCGEYDTVDSKGRELLSSRNEAGEYRGYM